MHITKKETKLMAFVTAFVMMLSCLVVIPTEAKASGAAPKVTVLGASLRMDADDGHQSMRIGVQVENASQAKACGVELTIGDKTVKIATDGDGETVLKGDKIYEYDTAKDTILYTAVITNIPKDNFDTKISAKGTAAPIEEGDAVVSDAVEKSVNDVVAGIQKDLPDVQMLDDGTLINKPIADLDTSTTDSLKANETQNDFYTWATASSNKDATASYDTTESALKFVTDSKDGKGLTYQISNNSGKYIYIIQVKADAGTILKLCFFNNTDPINSETFTATGDWQTITVTPEVGPWGACSLTTETPASTYYVKSCKIYRPMTSDDVTMHLPKETVTLSIADAVGGGTGKLTDGSPAPTGSVEKRTMAPF